LKKAGLGDIFLHVKTAENQKALAVLPSLCAGLDDVDDVRKRWVKQLFQFAGSLE